MRKPEVSIGGAYEHRDAIDLQTALQRLLTILEKELVDKQKTIDLYEVELIRLRKDQVIKDAELTAIKQQIQEAHEDAEGSRQLVNKLLNDIQRMQQDINWYKRTFENRSLVGTMKEKIMGRGLKRN